MTTPSAELAGLILQRVQLEGNGVVNLCASQQMREDFRIAQNEDASIAMP